ncbi:helix-turn-helix domain-containing protein [Streptomyces profundus]|uniref:helix-turn-helix domain-containing protein n=1 Tax=Streptomyces profundus TaxID=2867410 RepID=UPI001D162961|nr:helix-turn-helix domain-containing protein [Streptomyces sp. MA3_2.13]UED88480.1 helix-turn-helix domain-containing protein [Streptomyces sp. MA3_2.13]
MYTEWPAGRVPGAVVWRSVVGPKAESGLVLPDGSMDLILSEGRLLVAGPDTRAHSPAKPAGSVHVGLRFAPGQGPEVLGEPAHLLVDGRVPLDDLWPGRLVRELTERVALAAAPGEALQTIAARRLREAGPAEPWRSAAVAALGRGRTVVETAGELGFSERQLRRRSLSAFGYGPKTLARVLRMQRALARARAGEALALVAARAGYADQAHLAREIRDLAGVPITRLL